MKATAIYVPAARPCDSHCRLSAYDVQSRRTGIASGDYAASVGYANGKASTLGWLERTTSYTYRPGLNQLSGFTTEGTSTARAFEYDAQHRLTEIKLNGQLSTGYTLNDKDQRIRVESEDGSYWKFRYDGKSQVTAMERRRAGEEEQVTPGLYYGGFSYDDIGNWTETSRTGNTYYYLTSNILNQYTDVSTVWPMNTWNPTYDADGNMLTGIMGWSYGWNGENRLISAENGDTRLEFSYDYMGRRFEKKVYTANVLTKHEKFVYDGYKLIQVLDALNSDAVTMAFAWHPESTGLDTPFSMMYDGETYYYVTDGNKNVMSLIDAAGTKVAEYVYDPFGRLLSSTGSLAEINPFRFSSEYHDDETGLVYYNYRYYSPELGRWIKRDPIEEEGGVNLYAMVGNNPVNYWDLYGFGTFLIKQSLVDKKNPKVSVEAEVYADSKGFYIFWNPSAADKKKCKCGDFILAQAISSNGLSGIPSHIDATSGETINNKKSGYRSPPPKMEPTVNSWPYSYFDSPTGNKTGWLTGITSFTISSAAICVPKSNSAGWFVIDTVTFDLNNTSRELSLPNSAKNDGAGGFLIEGVPPGNHWNEAEQKWRGK